MSDIDETIGDAVDKAKESRLHTIVAVMVAVAATFMALCNVKDGNIVQAMAQAQANGVDAWAYYQAKGTKENLAQSTLEEIELQRDTAGSSLTPEARALYERKLAEYAERVKRYAKEKDEIKQQAEGFQKEYDRLNVHDDQFDSAEACFTISIALYGITALTQKRRLLYVALAFGALGIVLGTAGFLQLGLHPNALARLLG